MAALGAVLGALGTLLEQKSDEKRRITNDIENIGAKKIRDFYDTTAGLLQKRPPRIKTIDHNVDIGDAQIRIREYIPKNFEASLQKKRDTLKAVEKTKPWKTTEARKKRPKRSLVNLKTQPWQRPGTPARESWSL